LGLLAIVLAGQQRKSKLFPVRNTVNPANLFSLLILLFSCYIKRMTLQQTVIIPADRRLVLEVPETFSPGTAYLVLTSPRVEPDALKPKREDSLSAMQGMFKSDGHEPSTEPVTAGEGSLLDVDRFLARSHAEKVRENWNDERQRQESLAFRERREPPSGEWVNPLFGIAKDSSLTVERFMEMQEEEIDLENEYDERQRQESEKYRRRNET
jgi:hypothetical protein